MDLRDPKLTELAFRVLPVAREVARILAQNGAEGDIISLVSERISTIQDGLSPELEFIAAVNWLGRAITINRIDQTPLPHCHPTSEELRVPDILCVVSLDGRSVAFVIEVKKSSKNKLEWTEKYFIEQQKYAQALNLPLLVAWKWHHIWTLVDSRHFEKRVQAYHLSWETALQENLMSLIFGDAMIQLTQRVSFYLDGELTDLPTDLPAQPAPIPEGNHAMTITGAGFLMDGQPVTLSNELTWLFLRAPDENVVHRTSHTTIRTVHTPLADTMFSLTDFALMLMLWSEESDPDWEAVMRQDTTISAEKVREELQRGLDIGVVKYVIEQVPQTAPDFLPSAK